MEFFTDCLSAMCRLLYQFLAIVSRDFPSRRHQTVGKKAGGTNQIEGFNSKLCQRLARMVRKTLSFSKEFTNHIGAFWDFIHHYNLSLHG